MAAGAVLLLAVAANWIASRRLGIDFAHLYLAAVGIATGAPIYDPGWQSTAFLELGISRPLWGLIYPPATGFTTLPFAALPYSLAQATWFAVLILAMVAGVRGLLRLGRPDSRRGTWMLAAGVVLFSSCVRWGMTPLQAAPLLVGLLAILVIALHTNRPIVVFAVVAFATTLKFTMALPFLGLLLLHGRYAMLAGSLAVAGALTVLGFVRVGGLTAVADYSAAFGMIESVGTINSPDPWDPQSIPRLDWTYLFDGLTGDVQLSRILSLVVSALVALWLVREGRRVERPISLATTGAFLVPLVCLSVQSVYHHHYDISPLIVPLLVFCVRFREPRLFQRPWAIGLMIPIVVILALVPIDLTQRVLFSALGERGLGLLNLAFPAATSLALVGSLVIVRQTVRARASDRGPSGGGDVLTPRALR